VRRDLEFDSLALNLGAYIAQHLVQLEA
jgi:hypothetical protein